MSLPVVGRAHEAGAGPGPFVWFLYGSSLDRSAFTAWAEQHGYRLPDFGRAVPARLSNFRLSFDVESRFWQGTVASLREAPGDSVEGIALPLPAEARGLVDHKEGAISGLYVPFRAPVDPLSGGPPIEALIYRAAEERRLPAERAPSPTFVAALLRGGAEWGLSMEYRNRLAALAP